MRKNTIRASDICRHLMKIIKNPGKNNNMIVCVHLDCCFDTKYCLLKKKENNFTG